MARKSPENRFRDSKIRKYLDNRDNCYYFIKEAAGLRGIPDIIGCLEGKFFALEVKKSHAEVRKKTGRIVLQRWNIDRVGKARGFAALIYPENCEEVISSLEAFVSS